MSADSEDHPPAVRGARFRAKVLAATIEEVERRGFDTLRASDVADAAHVHLSSIYRNWKNLPHLVIDAMMSRTEAEIPVPDTGTIRGDLHAFVNDLARFSEGPLAQAFYRSVVLASADAVEVQAMFRGFWNARLTSLEPIVERGIARGEVRADTDPQLVVVLLGGFITFHSTFLDPHIPADTLTEAVQIALTGVSR